MEDAPQEQRLAAMGFMIVMTALLAGTSILAKALGQDTFGPAMHPLQISHGRFLFAFITFLLAAAVIRPKFTRPNFGIHFVRSFCGWASVSLLFAAITYIPLSDATAISFLSPVFAMMLAIPLLREHVGPVRWSAAAIALVGAVVLLRPAPDSFQPAAVMALCAASFMGMELVLVKILTGRERPMQILLVNNAIGLTIASIAAVFVWVNPELEQWAALAALGVMMSLAQVCFIQSLRRAEASFVAPFAYSTLIFATIYDFVVFDVVPDIISVIGAGIIVAGAVMLAWREARLKK